MSIVYLKVFLRKKPAIFLYRKYQIERQKQKAPSEIKLHVHYEAIARTGIAVQIYPFPFKQMHTSNLSLTFWRRVAQNCPTLPFFQFMTYAHCGIIVVINLDYCLKFLFYFSLDKVL